MAAESGPGLKMVAPIENGDFNMFNCHVNSPEGRNPSFQVGKSWIFFKKVHLFSQPMFATSLAENSIQRLGLRDWLRFVFFSFSPTEMRDSARRLCGSAGNQGFLQCFFRTRDLRTRVSQMHDLVWMPFFCSPPTRWASTRYE